MAQILGSNGVYTVVIDGQQVGQFGELIDASRLALSLLHDGLIDSVELFSGTIVR